MGQSKSGRQSSQTQSCVQVGLRGIPFFDPFVCYLDEEIVGSELRERIVGSTTTRVMLYIVYVMRDNVIRIVSARPATNAERRIYENQ
jgi:uncharacterized DUF497 family protein